MRTIYHVLLELCQSEFDTLSKCIERFREDSKFFDNSEYEVNAEEIQTKLLDNWYIEKRN